MKKGWLQVEELKSVSGSGGVRRKPGYALKGENLVQPRWILECEQWYCTVGTESFNMLNDSTVWVY